MPKPNARKIMRWLRRSTSAKNRKGHVKIDHLGAWAGEQSLATRRSDGAAYAVLVNSDDDPQLKNLYGTVKQFVQELKQVPDRAPRWKDYVFPEA